MSLILASGSPRRKELLSKITNEFIVAVADIDETVPKGMSPEAYVSLMAKEKAQVIHQQYPTDQVIGSDTIVVYGDQIMGKPKNRQEAKEMLQTLSGQVHQVYTAVYIVSAEKAVSELVKTEVTFFDLSSADIDTYLATGEYTDKAGAYGIQGQGALLVKFIKGDYYAIMGFPVAYVAQLLKSLES